MKHVFNALDDANLGTAIGRIHFQTQALLFFFALWGAHSSQKLKRLKVILHGFCFIPLEIMTPSMMPRIHFHNAWSNWILILLFPEQISVATKATLCTWNNSIYNVKRVHFSKIQTWVQVYECRKCGCFGQTEMPNVLSFHWNAPGIILEYLSTQSALYRYDKKVSYKYGQKMSLEWNWWLQHYDTESHNSAIQKKRLIGMEKINWGNAQNGNTWRNARCFHETLEIQ